MEDDGAGMVSGREWRACGRQRTEEQGRAGGTAKGWRMIGGCDEGLWVAGNGLGYVPAFGDGSSPLCVQLSNAMDLA